MFRCKKCGAMTGEEAHVCKPVEVKGAEKNTSFGEKQKDKVGKADKKKDKKKGKKKDKKKDKKKEEARRKTERRTRRRTRRKTERRKIRRSLRKARRKAGSRGSLNPGRCHDGESGKRGRKDCEI